MRCLNRDAPVARILMSFILAATVTAFWGTQQPASATDLCDTALEPAVPGVTVQVLACQRGLNRLGPSGLALSQIVLNPGDSVPLRETAWNELLYVDSGQVVVFDGNTFQETTISAGQHVLFDPAEHWNTFGLRNDSGAVAVVINAVSTQDAIAAQGDSGAMEFPLLGTSGSTDLLDVGGYMAFGSTNSQFSLSRVTMQPGTGWDFHNHVGASAIYVEQGSLSVRHFAPETARFHMGNLDYAFKSGEAVIPGSEWTTLAAGQYAVWPNSDVHQEWNSSTGPVTFLLMRVGPVSAAVTEHNSVLEIHSASCPAGFQGGDYFETCHANGRTDAHVVFITGWELVEGFQSVGAATLFVDVAPGVHRIAEVPASAGEAYIYCSSRGEVLFEQRGTFVEGFDVQIPPAANVICDWYSLA